MSAGSRDSVSCRSCNNTTPVLLDCGMQPIANRFLKSPDEHEALFPLRVGRCESCGLVQLAGDIPAIELLPRFDWITYNEPEGHLDTLADEIAGIAGTGPGGVAGLSYKDDTLLNRLRLRGLRDADGKASIIVARHILEHAANPREFLAELAERSSGDALLVCEIPSAEKMLTGRDYSFLWEEHRSYFTENTLARTLATNGFPPLKILRFPYAYEDSLVAICRKGKATTTGAPENGELFERFAAGFIAAAEAHRRALEKLNRGIAVFGAGHLAIKFINLYGLAEHIDCALDDHPAKEGLFLPGSHLPIVDSSILDSGEIASCLLSLSPESEAKVLARPRRFAKTGGKYYSIFRASKHALPLDDTER